MKYNEEIFIMNQVNCITKLNERAGNITDWKSEN